MQSQNTCQNITSTCQKTLNVNPSGSTNFDVAPATGPWSKINSACPTGQMQFIARQGVTQPFYYTCATNLDQAKTNFAKQATNQNWPLQNSQTICNSGGNTYTTCAYFNDAQDSETIVSAQTIKPQ